MIIVYNSEENIRKYSKDTLNIFGCYKNINVDLNRGYPLPQIIGIVDFSHYNKNRVKKELAHTKLKYAISWPIQSCCQ
jgi:hypothetical protein